MSDWLNIRKVFSGTNLVPLVAVAFFVLFYLILILSFNYIKFLNEMEVVVQQGDLDSRKMRLNSEMMEIARTRSRLTNQIIDIEDPFEQDELNVELEILANRYVNLRNQLLEFDLSPEEKQILLIEHAEIVSSILPAQRRVVELAMTGSPEEMAKARELLYSAVLPGQGKMVDSFGRMIAMEQKRIEKLTEQALLMSEKSRRTAYTLVSLVVAIAVVMSLYVLWHIRKIQNELLETNVNLEKKVEQRTEELSQARDLLQQQVDLVDRYVITSKSDPHGIITFASDAFCRISQYDRSELIGQPHSIVRHPDMPASIYEEMWKALKAGKSWEGELKNRAKDGSAYWVDVNIEPQFDGVGNIIGYAAVRQDITDKKRVEELSITDTLTKLFNRLKLDETLDTEIDRASRYKRSISVILFDVDHFKKVNDTFGHQSGDSVLIQMANVIRDTIRTTDVAGRWGGEEFLVICPDTALYGAVELSERLRSAIEHHDFGEIGRITSSFGVATLEGEENEDGLLARADNALYKAKEDGRNRVVVA